MQFGVGQPVPRTEDPKFLMGQGHYVDDIRIPHTAVGYVLRSPHPHAKVNGVNAEGAKAAPEVLLVLSGRRRPKASARWCTYRRWRLAGRLAFAHYSGARPGARVGDPVAFVVAETLAQAQDAAEMIEVNYEACQPSDRPVPR